jgi:hypothetical protein
MPVAVVAAEALSTVCLWQLDRIALGVRSWLAVACAQLTGSAVGGIVPGGGATATAFAVGMLRRAGVDGGQAVAGLTASTILQLGTALALPLVALPAIASGPPINDRLALAAYAGVAVLLLLIAVAAVMLTTTAPLRLAGRAAESLLNATVRRRRKPTGLPDRLIEDRSFLLDTLGAR